MQAADLADVHSLSQGAWKAGTFRKRGIQNKGPGFVSTALKSTLFRASDLLERVCVSP